MPFIQRAQGAFDLAVSGPYHCGPDDHSPKRFTYEVEIRYPDRALDERGFLLDNLLFEHFFAQLGGSDLSCERLAKLAAESLHAQTDGRALETSVAIWGIQNAARVEYRVGRASTEEV